MKPEKLNLSLDTNWQGVAIGFMKQVGLSESRLNGIILMANTTITKAPKSTKVIQETINASQ